MNQIISRLSKMVETLPNQEKIIAYMRQYGFKFITLELLITLYPKINLIPRDLKPGMTFMIRRISSLQWDTRFILGIKLNGKKRKTVSVYYELQHLKNVTKDWKDAADINFRKIVIKMIFPDYLTYVERRNWRREHDKAIKDPDYKPSQFYLKVKPDIKWINQ